MPKRGGMPGATLGVLVVGRVGLVFLAAGPERQVEGFAALGALMQLLAAAPVVQARRRAA